MAEDTGQERTEEPTGKRLSDAKDKGQVVRSRELNTFIVLVVGSVAILALGQYVTESLWTIMREQFQLNRAEIFDSSALLRHFGRVMWSAGMMLAPFLLIMVVAALVGPLALGGWSFSFESMQPKFEKMDPIKGVARLFGVRGLIELLKSLLKFLLIFGITVSLFMFYFQDFVGLNSEPLGLAIKHGTDLIGFSLLILSASVGLIAVIDVPFQMWDHKKKLKMTRQEVKDEMKDTDGRPEIKSRIRSLQMELAQSRMMEEVPKADVIVTNPTHVAVALKYDQDQSVAPRVVAKGADLIAAHIRNLANASKVPVVSAPPLARAIYHSTEIDSEIPEGLYLAVAQVLAYVYQLRTAFEQGEVEPDMPVDLHIPDEYKI